VDVDLSKPEVSAAGNPDPGQWQRGPVTLVVIGRDQPALSGMEGYDPNTGQLTDGGYLEYRVDGDTAQRAAADHIGAEAGGGGAHGRDALRAGRP